MIIRKEVLVGKFAETMGQEKADELINDTMRSTGFASTDVFNEDEAFAILDKIKQEEGIVATVACYISAAIMSSCALNEEEFS
ncbi:MAG: hypothetical protein JXR42_02655 [Gammaproteobacteria bacterium]|nr:hypothetical protein [Gammaproteobacteria bacterium]